MANNVKKVNGIAIADIAKVNGQDDDDLAKLNGEEFTGTVPSIFGDRFIGAAGGLYPPGDGNIYMKKHIHYKASTSDGASSDFGDLTVEVGYGAGVSNGTRFVQMAGEL